MTKRSVDSKIRSSFSFSRLTFRQRDLWHGIIEVVDDQGRMPGEPAYVRSMVWAFDDVPLSEVEQDLQALVKNEMIYLYQKNGATFLQIINWWKYQSSNWMGKSEYPAPDNWIDRCRYHGKGNKIIEKCWSMQGGFANQDSNQDSELDSLKHCHDDDVNGDVNDDVNVNGDDDGNEPRTHFWDLETYFHDLSGLEIDESWNEAENKLIREGITPSVLKRAWNEIKDKPQYKIKGLQSMITPCIKVKESKDYHKLKEQDYQKMSTG